MAATMEAVMVIMFNMHACVCAHACMCMHMCMCMGGAPHPTPPPPNPTLTHPPTPRVPFKDLESVETSPPMGGCFFCWLGGWMGGLVGQNM